MIEKLFLVNLGTYWSMQKTANSERWIKMRIETLYYLIAIKNYGSLSKAAEKLYLTHSALSISLFNVEKELGVQIFSRTNKGVIVTDIGKECLDRIEKILELYEEILLLNNNKAEEKLIEISSITTLSNNILLHSIARFNKEYPSINIRSNEMQPHEVVDSVYKKECQLGISFIELEKADELKEYIYEKKLVWDPVYTDELCLYVNKHSPLLKKEQVLMSDLNDVVAVSINHRHFSSKKNCYQNNVDNNFHLSFSNQEVIKKLIAESNDGALAAFFPKLLLYDDYYTKSGDLVPIDIIDESQKIVYYMVYSERIKYEDIVNRFIDEVKFQFEEVKQNRKHV